MGESARKLDVLLHSFKVENVLQMKPEGPGSLSDNRQWILRVWGMLPL